MKKLIEGYLRFREKYTSADAPIMQQLAHHGQKPEIMIVSCCDSRVDPSLILQCDPGELFSVRNVANIVPPYEPDGRHHGTSAALEFGICYLNVRHLVIMGHSQCGGIHGLLHSESLKQNDFIFNWVSIVDTNTITNDVDAYAKQALFHSYQNCLSFPWIKERVEKNTLMIHLWFFDIKEGELSIYSFENQRFQKLMQ